MSLRARAGWQGSKASKVELSEVEDAAFEASTTCRAPVWFDPWQAIAIGQNLKKRGRPVHEYQVTAESRRRLFNILLDAIRGGRLLCRPHEELRRELLGLEVKEALSGVFRVDHKPGRHDDHVFAVALGLAGALEHGAGFVLPVMSWTKRFSDTTTKGEAPEPKGTATYSTKCPVCGIAYAGTAKMILASVTLNCWSYKADRHKKKPCPTTIEEMLHAS
jgi:hypothetical protein